MNHSQRDSGKKICVTIVFIEISGTKVVFEVI
jgi:hypothetical protein